MPLLRRNPRPAPKPVDMPAVIRGIRAFADQLENGDPTAVDLLEDGEHPATAEGWALYPHGNWRLG